MDPELAVLLAISRRLPRVKGAGRIADAMRRFYLRRRRSAVTVPVHGSLMRLQPEQYVDGWLLFGPQFYEFDEVRYVRRELRPGDVFLDIGAHLGLYALVASRVVGPSGRVLAIEADPATAEILSEDVAMNEVQNVTVLAVGVSDRAERRRLAPRSRSNLASASFLVDAPDAVLVECRTLDDLVVESRVGRIDMAKLDIEGFEQPVLRRYFDTAPTALWPRAVIVEHYAHLAAQAGDVLALLRGLGYVLRARYGTNHIFERSETSSV